ncbi:DEAD/DEAH box helicase [Balamuthia mandrillaris]
MERKDSSGGAASSNNATPTSEFVPLHPRKRRKGDNSAASAADDHEAEQQESNKMPSYYKRSKSVAGLKDNQVARLRDKYGIEVKGRDVESPILEFHEAGLPAELLHLLASCEFHEPTPIQMQTLPCAMSGRDVIAIAETGSGKTLAYLLPMLMLLRTLPPTGQGEGPLAVILAPTRELAEQINGEVQRFLPAISSVSTAPPPSTSALTFSAASSPYASFPAPFPSPYYPYPSSYDYYNYYNPYFPQQQQLQQFNQQSSFSSPVLSASSSAPFYWQQQQHMSAIQRRSCVVTGGVPLAEQIQAMLLGVDVVVATPGRLLDLINRGAMLTDRVAYLVLDEADQMLALQMEDQLRQIINNCRTEARQTLLFSATMPTGIQRLARSAVLNPVTIQDNSSHRSPQQASSSSSSSTSLPSSFAAASRNIRQKIIFLAGVPHPSQTQKQQRLLQVLRRTKRPPVIVFCNAHETVDRLTAFLKEKQFHVAALHGEKKQSYRSAVMRAFKEQGLDVLVATDLAARGIDVKDVQHVILYDMPPTIESYVHRIGRTGRAGRQGKATAFLTLQCTIAKELKELLQQTQQNIPKELEDPTRFGRIKEAQFDSDSD